MLQQASPTFSHTLVSTERRLLIQSTCRECGATKLVSHADHSVEEWEEKHSAQHKPVESEQLRRAS